MAKYGENKAEKVKPITRLAVCIEHNYKMSLSSLRSYNNKRLLLRCTGYDDDSRG